MAILNTHSQMTHQSAFELLEGSSCVDLGEEVSQVLSDKHLVVLTVTL